MSNYMQQKFPLGTVWGQTGGRPNWTSLRTSPPWGELRLCCWGIDPRDSAILAQLNCSRQKVSILRNYALFFSPKLHLPGPHLIHGSLAYPSSQPKRHLDRFSRFCRAHSLGLCDVRQTDRQIDKPRYSVSDNRPHLYVLSTCDAA